MDEKKQAALKEKPKKGDILGVHINAVGSGRKNGKTVVIAWGAYKSGFGELTIITDAEGDTKIRTETMGKDFAKRVLNKLIDDAEVTE